MQKMEFVGKVSGGKIPLHVSKGVGDVLKKMDGKTVKIILQENRKKRSNPQNSFYYGVVIPEIQKMFADSGTDIDMQTTHEYLKRYVGNLTKVLETPDGRKEIVTRSSTELNTIDWEIFIEKIRAWAAPFGVLVPFPNEVAAQNLLAG